jgi:hypothetical protein
LFGMYLRVIGCRHTQECCGRCEAMADATELIYARPTCDSPIL